MLSNIVVIVGYEKNYREDAKSAKNCMKKCLILPKTLAAAACPRMILSGAS